MKHAILENGTPVEYTGRFHHSADGIQTPLKPLSEAEKKALNPPVYEVKRDLSVPAGRALTGTELVHDAQADTVIERATYEQKPLEEYRAELHRSAQVAYSHVMLPIAKAYPAEEREGWAEQVEAAQEVLAGGQNDLIDALRAPTGETAQEMAQRIITKRQEYLALYGAATATRRGLDAQIVAATTHAELDAIDVQGAFSAVSA